jgi:hypothetical protein
MKSAEYINVLEDYLLPFSDEVYGDDFFFQQDNASIHVSRETRAWFQNLGLSVLEWPARSPDLNPIENLWSILAQRVYDKGKMQFKTKDALKNRILECWNGIEPEVYRKLVDTMAKRCITVIAKQGGKTRF